MGMTPQQVEHASQALREMKRCEDMIARFTERDIIGIKLSGDLMLEIGMGGGSGWIYSVGYPEDLRKAMTAALIKWAEDKYLNARDNALRLGVELPPAKGDPKPLFYPNHELTIDMSQFVVIDYTNWKGNRRERSIRPIELFFGINERYHPKKQWLLKAIDLEDHEMEVSETEAKPKTKDFAMSNIHSWKPYIGDR